MVNSWPVTDTECDALGAFCGLSVPKTPRMPGGGTPLPNEGRISVKGIQQMTLNEPATRPANPRFSSGPCAKPPVHSNSTSS
jgi:hypothetical protein